MGYSGKLKSHKDLAAYQKAYDLCIDVYKSTDRFPREEMYGLTNQMRRAAVSVPSNIAEGYRRNRKEYVHFLRIAFGSLAELDTQVSLSRDLEMMAREQAAELLDKIDSASQVLFKLIKSLE